MRLPPTPSSALWAPGQQAGELWDPLQQRRHEEGPSLRPRCRPRRLSSQSWHPPHARCRPAPTAPTAGPRRGASRRWGLGHRPRHRSDRASVWQARATPRPLTPGSTASPGSPGPEGSSTRPRRIRNITTGYKGRGGIHAAMDAPSRGSGRSGRRWEGSPQRLLPEQTARQLWVPQPEAGTLPSRGASGM